MSDQTQAENNDNDQGKNWSSSMEAISGQVQKCFGIRLVTWLFAITFIITIVAYFTLLCAKWNEHLALTILLLIAIIVVPTGVFIYFAKEIHTRRRIAEAYRHKQCMIYSSNVISKRLESKISCIIAELTKPDPPLCPQELYEIIKNIIDTDMYLAKETIKVMAKNPLKPAKHDCSCGCC